MLWTAGSIHFDTLAQAQITALASMIPVHRPPDFTMTDTPASAPDKRSIWVRGLFMVLMAIAFHIAGMLLAVGAIIQFVLALVSDGPNGRLIGFGQSLGRYLGQVAEFVSFTTAKRDQHLPEKREHLFPSERSHRLVGHLFFRDIPFGKLF